MGICCSFFTHALASEDEFAPVAAYSQQALSGGLDRNSELAFFALGLSGIQYKYGGNSPDMGLDCSGLVRYVFKQVLDKELPRSSEEISHIGSTVEDHELQPGDLVFFNTLKRAFSHVGIYLGENRFIHSPASGGKVRVENLDMRYWRQRFNGARRIIGLPEVTR